MRPIFAVLSLCGFLSSTQVAAETGPVVVELYTSQGCSSCPPADAILHDLAKRDDVIALALHVDYWDYIGWKDAFASPEYTRRQHGYAQAARATTVYTPQMVIGGVDHVIGSRPMQVSETLQTHLMHAAQTEVAVQRAGDELTVTAEAIERGDYIVQLVRYIPEETVAIRRGENAGRELSYSNIVTGWNIIGRWDGVSALQLTSEVTGDQPGAIIIQRNGYGPIVGAAHLR